MKRKNEFFYLCGGGGSPISPETLQVVFCVHTGLGVSAWSPNFGLFWGERRVLSKTNFIVLLGDCELLKWSQGWRSKRNRILSDGHSTDLLTVRMNHFQRLNEVKELKIFFSAQRANTRKQASSRRLLPCNALAPTAQNPRKRAVREWHVSTQKTGSYITERSRLPGLIVGPCPSEESLCCPACPPALPCFRRVSAPSL